MKLAFNNKAHYTDFDAGYGLYVRRSRGGKCLSEEQYRKAIKMYCRYMAKSLCDEGAAELPCGLGMITAAIITRKPQYRGKKFVGYGKMDWQNGTYDGKLKAFGVVYLPRHEYANLRCFGYVANRRLFKKMKDIYTSYDCPWQPVEFKDEMI